MRAALFLILFASAPAFGAERPRVSTEQRPHEFLVENTTTEEPDGYVTTKRVYKYATPTGRWKTFTVIISEPGPNYVWPDGHRGPNP